MMNKRKVGNFHVESFHVSSVYVRKNKKNCESAKIDLNFQLVVSRTMQFPTECLPALKSDFHFFEIFWQRWSCFKFEIDKIGPFWVKFILTDGICHR